MLEYLANNTTSLVDNFFMSEEFECNVLQKTFILDKERIDICTFLDKCKSILLASNSYKSGMDYIKVQTNKFSKDMASSWKTAHHMPHGTATQNNKNLEY